MRTRLDRQIERWLRWYPVQWRERNGEALRGTLLDQAEATGADRLTFADRTSLVIAGLMQRHARRRRDVSFIAAGLLLILTLVYAIGISWSPGLESPGTFLWFSNPTVVALGIAVASAVAGVLSLPRTALVLGVTAFVLELAFVIAGERLSWQGPGWSFLVLFAGLVALVVAPLQSRRTLVVVVFATIALSVVLQLVMLVLVPLVLDLVG